MNFERILFAVDLSDQSRHAAPFVNALATRFQSEVVLLHVLDPHLRWSGFPETDSWQAVETVTQVRETESAALDAFLPEAFAGLPVQRILAEGDPAQQIVCLARKKQCGLIMMPTHGRGIFRSVLLGSVTAKVLHDAECPVWTGVHRREWSAHPPDHWQRILCAVDALPEDIPTVQWAADLGKSQGAEVRIVHALGGVPPDCRSYAGESLRERLMEAAYSQLDKLQDQAGTDLEAAVVDGSPAKAVHDAAVNFEADLVVVGRGAIQQPLGRLRSNAYAIIRESPCPVISV